MCKVHHFLWLVSIEGSVMCDRNQVKDMAGWLLLGKGISLPI